jgi:hypothetical protein
MKSLIESLQILPPWNDDVKFENFITAYFNDFENTSSYDRFGRSGQKQYGLDVYSTEKKTVIQCKLKLINGKNDEKIRNELITELDKDYMSFLEYNKKNNLAYNRFIFASTFYSDTHISTECAKKTTDSIVVEYWSWDKLKNNLPEKVFKTYYGEFQSFLEEYYSKQNSALYSITNNTSSWFNIDKKKPLIDQLYDYFKNLFSEVNVLPIHLLINNYPFKKSDNYYPYYSLFTLSTDNDELFELFESIKIEYSNISISDKKFTKEVKNYSKKLKFILSKLSEHLVFNIQNNKSHKTINIRYSIEKSCSCIRCSFDRLNYEDALNGLLEKPKKIEDKLLLAYMHYELGNFVESVNYFEDIAIDAKKQKHNIRYTIAQYNLSKLFVFIRNNYWEKNEQPELTKKLKAIETESLYCELKTEENKKLLDWILNSKFYSSKREEISKTVNKIKDHYYSQLKGGWSSNNHIGSLINDYAEIETFLNSNFIIFDRFSEYQEITDNFIEGLIISHAMNEDQTNRLEHFDDWLYLRIIFNGNSERILKLFNRYELKSLKYKPTSQKGETFFDVLNNQLMNYQNILSTFEKTCEKSNRIFWERYNSIFCNLMTLASISDIEAAQIKLISKKLLTYSRNSNFINHISIKYVRLFIKRKGEFIEKSDLYGFLNLYITNGKFHENDFIESVIYQIKKHYNNLIIDNKVLEELFSIAFDKCKLCNHKHNPEFITRVFDATNNSDYKNEIKKRIETELNKKFDNNLYYMSAIYDVFDSEDDFFNTFIESVKPKPNKISFKSAFTGSADNRFSQVNMLLNLCYKFGVDLSKEIFDDFRNLDMYYSWLFDMEHFDYNNFNPKWTTEYQTKYFFRQFQKFPIIKEKILEFLKENQDYMLEKLLIELTSTKEY